MGNQILLIVVGLFVVIFLYGTGYWLAVLLFFLAATMFGMIFGKEEREQYKAVSKRPADRRSF